MHDPQRDIPYKIEPGERVHVISHGPDPRDSWAPRLILFAIVVTIAACLAAVFFR